MPPAAAEWTAAPSPSAEPLRPGDDTVRSVAYFDRAVEAFKAMDQSSAVAFAEQAVAELEPESRQNVTWYRVKLLADLQFFQRKLDQYEDANATDGRRADAFVMMMRIDGGTQGWQREVAEKREAPPQSEAAFEIVDGQTAGGEAAGELSEDREESSSAVDVTEEGGFNSERYGVRASDLAAVKVPEIAHSSEDPANFDREAMVDLGVSDDLAAALDADRRGDEAEAFRRYERFVKGKEVYGVAGVPLTLAIRITLATQMVAVGAEMEGLRLLAIVGAELDRTGRGASPEAAEANSRLADAYDAAGDHARAAERRRAAYEAKRGSNKGDWSSWFSTGSSALGSLIATNKAGAAQDFGRGFLQDLLPDGDLGPLDEIEKIRYFARTGFDMGLFDLSGRAYSKLDAGGLGPLPDLDKLRYSAALAGSGDHAGARALAEAVLAAHAGESSDLTAAAKARIAASSLALGDYRRAREAAADRLEQEKRRFSEDHPRVQAGRSVLAEVAFAQGGLLEAYALQREGYESLTRTLPAGHPVLVRARDAWLPTLHALGRLDEAVALLPDASSARAVAAGAERDVEALLREAASDQRECRFDEALDLRRRAVEMQREALSPRDPRRIEGLAELAALLRVIGSTAEARELEIEVERLRMVEPGEGARLADLLAASRDAAPPAESPVRIRCTVVGAEPGGATARVIAEVEDPAGILALHVVQDGAARLVDAHGGGWEISVDGRGGRLELPVEVRAGELLSVVSIAVENVWGERSPYETAVVWSPEAR